MKTTQSQPGPNALLTRATKFILMNELLFGGLMGAHPGRAQSPYEWVKATGTSPPVDVYEDWDLAYDPSTKQVLAVPDFGDGLKETWTWNGQTWTPNGYPPPDHTYGLVHHGSTDSFYRLQFVATLEPMKTFVLVTNVGWVLVDSSGPNGRNSISWAYDASRGMTVLFGGHYGFQPTHPAWTWEWNGLAWSVFQGQENTRPPQRTHTAMAYDARNRVVVLYGGIRSIFHQDDNELTDTWTWDGQSWQEHEVTGPGRRTGHVMIYDSVREKVLLFGGARYPEQQLGDLWEWNGSAWSEIPVSGPEPRVGAGFAYDEARGEAVLYSGTYREDGFPVPLSDTWVLRVREAWVDFDYTGPETGGFDTPFNTVAEAVNSLPPEGRVRLKPGVTSEVITISKQLRIDAPLGAARIGQP